MKNLYNSLLVVIVANALTTNAATYTSVKAHGLVDKDPLVKRADPKNEGKFIEVPEDKATWRGYRYLYGDANIMANVEDDREYSEEELKLLGSQIYDALLFISTPKHNSFNGRDVETIFADREVTVLCENAVIREALKTLPTGIIDVVVNSTAAYERTVLADSVESSLLGDDEKTASSQPVYKAIKKLLG